MNIGTAIAAAVSLVIIITLIFVIPVWLLWNALMPDVFGLPSITFWQALGLLLLSGMLIKSSGSNK